MDCAIRVAKTKALNRADLWLCSRICKVRFSHEVAQIIYVKTL